jgi:hypothetical protein
MPYKISIVKLEPNPSFDEQYKAYLDASRGYGRDPIMPEKEYEIKKLDTVLTDAEFDVIRKACFGSM